MTKLKLITAVAACAVLAACGQGQDKKSDAGGAGGARSQVWVAGSSTVAPFASRVAETLARKTGGQAARVESLGTGGGFKAFCAGTGSAHPDIATASRPMKASEFDACQQAGVTDIAEIKIGYDGIVIVTAKSGADYDFKRADLYRGLAAESPNGSGFAPNAFKTWREVSPSLPAARISVYGPPPTSGTRDAFVELALEGGAGEIDQLKALKASNEDEFKAKAGVVRTDGAWIDAGENDNAIIGTLTKTPGALGVVGYSFLDNNRDNVKAAKVGGVEPTYDNIANGAYPLSRSLFIYVKKANLPLIPALKDYVAEFVSDAAAGPGGYLQPRGLITLPKADHDAVKQAATDLPPIARPAK
jgi:phosphate transport system substrate-binding protein